MKALINSASSFEMYFSLSNDDFISSLFFLLNVMLSFEIKYSIFVSICFIVCPIVNLYKIKNIKTEISNV